MAAEAGAGEWIIARSSSSP